MTKARINGPQDALSLPRYRQECRQAIEPSFESLIAAAAKAGWDRQELAYTLLVLAADACCAFGLHADPVWCDMDPHSG